jgi:hypothetical protein
VGAADGHVAEDEEEAERGDGEIAVYVNRM